MRLPKTCETNIITSIGFVWSMLELTVISFLFIVPPVQERSVQASEKVHYHNRVELLCLWYLFIMFLVDFSDHNYLVGIPWN